MFTTVTEVTCCPGKAEAVRELCRSLLGELRREPGCLDLRLYVDTEHDDRLVFIAAWEREQDWLAHIESPRQRELAAQAASEEGRMMMVGWKSQYLQEIANEFISI